MCGGGNAPKPAPRLPQAPVMPVLDSSSTGRESRRRQRTATILTSNQGADQTAPVGTGQKTTLG
jgi:hypothetical protein